MLLEHVNESVKHKLADAQLKRESRWLEKESMEHVAIDVLMHLTGPVAASDSRKT